MSGTSWELDDGGKPLVGSRCNTFDDRRPAEIGKEVRVEPERAIQLTEGDDEGKDEKG